MIKDEADFYEHLYRKNKGIFYRGESRKKGGIGLGLSSLGDGLYLAWDRGMAQAFADKIGGEVYEYKVKPGLKMLDAQSNTMAEIKKTMGFQPWEYSGSPMYGKAVRREAQRLGFDGVISDKVAEGMVIFNPKNAEKHRSSLKKEENKMSELKEINEKLETLVKVLGLKESGIADRYYDPPWDTEPFEGVFVGKKMDVNVLIDNEKVGTVPVRITKVSGEYEAKAEALKSFPKAGIKKGDKVKIEYDEGWNLAEERIGLKENGEYAGDLERWVNSVLQNDEASTDAELVGHFQKEGGLSKEESEWVVSQRGKALRDRHYWVELFQKRGIGEATEREEMERSKSVKPNRVRMANKIKGSFGNLKREVAGLEGIVQRIEFIAKDAPGKFEGELDSALMDALKYAGEIRSWLDEHEEYLKDFQNNLQ